jgi:hypothetical protein
MDRPAIRMLRWSCVTAVLGLASAAARAQAPADGTPPPAACNRRGPVHRLLHHSAHTFEDKVVGYPDTFIEPPLGYYVTEQLSVQVAKADTHRFTLYRSDFLPGTSLFSPSGASRFNLMFARFPSWLGPIAVEWTPDQPALAQSRRQAVLDAMQQAGQPILAQRVVVIPSPYPGAYGTEATNNYSNMIFRGVGAASAFPLSPTESASTGVH